MQVLILRKYPLYIELCHTYLRSSHPARNIDPMWGHCSRRWANVNQTAGQRFVFTSFYECIDEWEGGRGEKLPCLPAINNITIWLNRG